jgi:hypothetical protein
MGGRAEVARRVPARGGPTAEQRRLVCTLPTCHHAPDTLGSLPLPMPLNSQCPLTHALGRLLFYPILSLLLPIPTLAPTLFSPSACPPASLCPPPSIRCSLPRLAPLCSLLLPPIASSQFQRPTSPGTLNPNPGTACPLYRSTNASTSRIHHAHLLPRHVRPSVPERACPHSMPALLTTPSRHRSRYWGFRVLGVLPKGQEFYPKDFTLRVLEFLP